MREDLINWKKSTMCSEFTLSNMACIQMNAPVRPIPSLYVEREDKGSINKSEDILAHDCDWHVSSVPLDFVEL